MEYKEKIYNNFVNDFRIILKEKVNNNEFSKLIFLCIGTDRITGDTFGPLVGYKLKNLFYGNENIEVIGDLENSVNSCNILNIINYIKKKYENPFLIAIDSAVSNKIEIGKIIVSNKKMNVGGSLNRYLYLGDISIKGVVSKDLNNRNYNFKLLQNVPLNIIMNMADSVVQGIYDVINV